MRRRTQWMCAGAAVLALAGGLVVWLVTRPGPDESTTVLDPTPPSNPRDEPFDAAHEAEETVPAAELDALRRALQDADPFTRIAAADRLVSVSARNRAAAIHVLIADSQTLYPSQRNAAEAALERLQGPAVAALVAAVKTEIAPTHETIGQALHRIGPAALPPLIAAFTSSDPDLHRFANFELHRWGPGATPGLSAALRDPRYVAERPRLALLLLEIDPPHAADATPHLLALLREPDGSLRRRALEVLIRLGPQPDQAPVYVAALRESDPGVRAQAAVALRQLGPAALSGLRALAADASAGADARRAALEVLGRLRPAAAEAVPDLVAILRGGDATLYPTAALALLRMGPPGVAGLVQVVRDDLQDTRKAEFEGVGLFGQFRMLHDCQASGWFAAATQLSRLGPAGKQAAPTLAAVLRDPRLNAADQELIATALENMGPDTVPLLAALVQDPSGRARLLAVRVLGRLGPAAREAAPALGKMLRLTDDPVSDEAGFALAAVGPEAVPTLRALLREPDARVIDRAAWVLSLLGPAAKEAVPDLTALLHHPAEGTRLWAAQALTKIGPDAKEAVPPLRDLLAGPPGRLPRVAAHALAAIGPAAKEAVPALRQALQSPDKILRLTAAEALLRIGPTQAQGAADVLRSALLSGNELVEGVPLRSAAVDVVRHLGPAAKEFVPALQPLLKDQSPYIRIRAAEPLLLLADQEWHEQFLTLALAARFAELQAAAARSEELLAVLLAGRLTNDLAETLERLGPSAAKAIPTLRAALSSLDGGLEANPQTFTRARAPSVPTRRRPWSP